MNHGDVFTSAHFPLNSEGRHVLPLPSQSPSAPISVPTLPSRMSGLPSTLVSSALYPIIDNSHHIPKRASYQGHKRNISASTAMSSAPSDDLFSSPSSSSSATSPSSSRCSSPSSPKMPALASGSRFSASAPTSVSTQPECQFSLVPRGKPFPSHISLNDIEPTDALLFFPDAETAPTKAILLVGPAIARHINQQHQDREEGAMRGEKKLGRSSSRMHPYRIVVRPSRGEKVNDGQCGISRVLRGVHHPSSASARRRVGVSLASSPSPPSSRSSLCPDSNSNTPEWAEWARGASPTTHTLSQEWERILRNNERELSPSSESEMEEASSDAE